ncbi:MAG TPA: hypothetical protein VGK98_18820 [Arthrobacter sp.]|uniref:hypothetical protein n=1 Tax=Arthrobacter sp. TaxID=1667 RepID=UPI002F4185DD
MALGDPDQQPACTAVVLLPGDVTDDLLSPRVALTLVFHGNLMFRIANVGLTYDAGTEFRAHVELRFRQARKFQRQP